MMTPAMAVRAWLAADPAVADLTEGHVYQLHLPQAPDYPAIVVQTVSEPVRYHQRGPAGLVTTRIQVDSYADETAGGDGKYTVDQTAAAVDAALSGQIFSIGTPPLTVTGVFRQNRIDLYEAEELRVYRVMLEYLVWSAPWAGVPEPPEPPVDEPFVSTFLGTENPLSEDGRWTSGPGAWTDLQKDNGALTALQSSAARLVTPTVAGDQYSEITYDQDPLGATTWVGCLTRMSPINGSGYLVIAFDSSLRLYRVVDLGTLDFAALLGTVPASLGFAPRTLRLTSTGATHTVSFNGVDVLTETDGTVLTGQPGIAASVFPGPPVRIQRFETFHT